MSVKAILVGAVTTFGTSITISVFMLVIFIDLAKTGDEDVMITSLWPQIYTLGNVLVSGIVGVYICSVVANKVLLINSLGVGLVSLGLTYIINRPSSEYSALYPTWFVVVSYLLCLVSVISGHFLSKLLIKPKTS